MDSGSDRPLKVAHIITRMILGGAQENTLYTVEGLHRMPEYEAILITGPAIGPEGELLEEARKAGFQVIVIPEMRREIHLSRDWKTYRKLKRILRDLSPDIVHTHSSKAGIFGRMAAKKVGTPLIIHTIHGPSFHPNQNAFINAVYIALEKFAGGFTDKIFSVADAMSEQFIEAGIAPADKFVTVYSGMDVNAFLNSEDHREETRRKLGFTPDNIVVGKVGRLFPLKGFEFMPDLLADLCPRYPELRFLFVGDGILRKDIEERADQIGVLDRIVFTGLVPASEVPIFMSGMDVLIHASLREGLARVLPQALISGKPVIAFDVDGAPEVVINAETGFLVEPRSVSGLAEAIEKILNDRELGRKLGENGREKFSRQFDKQVMVDHIDRLYKELWAQQPTLN